jgi:hypothetical protein
MPAAFLLFATAQLTATIINHKDELPWTFTLFLLPIIGYMIFWLWKILPDANRTHPMASAFGLAVAVLLGFALLAAAAALGGHESEQPHVARYMIIVLVVFLPTLGGAMRFLSEKLAIEAEALSYRDAHVWFEHAKDLLSEQPPGKGDPRADKCAQDIVSRLGTLAIYENEAWLKLRRQRPLSPVI